MIKQRTLAIRVTEDQYLAYSQEANALGCDSVSEWARTMLDTAAKYSGAQERDMSKLEAAKEKLEKHLVNLSHDG